MLKLFFLHPLIASVAAVAAFSLPFLDLSVVKAAGIFAGVWFVLSAIHIALRQRRFWVQLEPLLLMEDEGEEQIEHKSPFAMKPAWATAATVLIGAGVVWASVPQAVIERAPEATFPVAQATTAAPAAPVEVATVAPPREALPPTPPTQAWKPETTSPAVAAEAPKAEPPAAPDRIMVLATQRLLSDLGYDVGGIDGRVGSRTRAAIKAFREQRGLSSEEINPGLVAALESAAASGHFNPAPASTNTPVASTVEPRPSPTRPARAGEAATLSNADIRTPEPFRPTEATPLAPRRITEPSRAEMIAPAARSTEGNRTVDSSLSTASLNREQTRAPSRAPAAQVPVNGTMMPMVPRNDDNAPFAAPPRQPQQQAEAPIATTPKTVPIHTLVPTIPAPASAPVIVDPSSASAQREMQAPIRLGPPVRLHY